MPAPTTVQPDPQSSYRAIENLITNYTDLIDAADFAAIGELLADATFTFGNTTVSGGESIAKMLEDLVIVHEDGTLRTKHVTTNVFIEVDEDAGTAISRVYATVLQAVPGELPLQPIMAGRYWDRFERHEGRWRFIERRAFADLLGDVSNHLSSASTQS